MALILYLVSRILRPKSALTQVTKEIRKGNFSTSVQPKGSDELAVLSESFNSMIYSIKNYIEKQKQLTEELKTANEELKQRDRMKDDFINVAAHEMRTPIQPILGLSELLRSRRHENNNSPVDKEEDELLDMIISNAKRLVELEENILDVTRIENGLLKLNMEKCELAEIILDAVRNTENNINKYNVQLQYNSNLQSPTHVNADRAKLTQVVSNLLSNALNLPKKDALK